MLLEEELALLGDDDPDDQSVEELQALRNEMQEIEALLGQPDTDVLRLDAEWAEMDNAITSITRKLKRGKESLTDDVKKALKQDVHDQTKELKMIERELMALKKKRDMEQHKLLDRWQELDDAIHGKSTEVKKTSERRTRRKEIMDVMEGSEDAKAYMGYANKELSKAQREMIKAKERGDMAQYESLKEVVRELEDAASMAGEAAHGEFAEVGTLRKSAEFRTWQRQKRRNELLDAVADPSTSYHNMKKMPPDQLSALQTRLKADLQQKLRQSAPPVPSED